MSAHRRRAIIPEVIQISATDCGPASLKSMFAGMGVELNYRVLREVCQTDIDGTSIVTLDEVANQLGLDAEEVMLPVDHVVLPEAKALPAIIVTMTAGGRPHFIVVWKRIGPFVQIMDPAAGRLWMRSELLLSSLYKHTTSVPAEGWREWAGSEEATRTVERRLANLGVAKPKALLAEALADPAYKSIAALDAACRATEAMVRAGAVKRGRTASDLVQSMIAREAAGTVPIPETYWSVRPNPEVPGELLLTGSVLLRVKGWREGAADAEAPKALIAPEIAKEISAPQSSPTRALLRLLKEDPWSIPLLVIAGLVVATSGRVLQALMLRAVLDLGRDLGTIGQRATGLAVLAAVALILLLIQIPISLGLLGIGRRLEVRLRKAYFEQLPKTEDRYFQSRLASDMASRSHNIQAMRTLPQLIAQAMTITLEIVATTAALMWAAPGSWGLVLALSAATLLLPLIAQKVFLEPDMRVQSQVGALSKFILDALVGLTPIKIHGAERSLRRSQETLLVSWTKARYWLQSLAVAFEGLLMLVSYGLVVWLVYAYLAGDQRASLVLLVVFWALRFPILGQRLLMLSRSFPSAMNKVRRLLDIIGEVKPEPTRSPPELGEIAASTQVPGRGVAIAMEKVKVRGGGHTILDRVNLNIAPGEHVAIVGVSGAGKSTLVGLLLGWLRPARGKLEVDGAPLDGPATERLRRMTAWVDPAVSIWNQSLLDNLRYGTDAATGWSLDAAIRGAEMLDILEALPEGLQTSLGEGGGLVSGGQGQRVRLARAMLRSNVRLAILDEPFRGLDRDRRKRLLAESRRLWAEITLMCVTHDVEHTQEFDRVLVVENGKIVENGSPKELLATEGSRYGELLRADQDNHALLWGGASWRHWWLADGRLVEKPAEPKS